MKSPEISKAEGVDLLSAMWRIRAFEEKVSELYARGKVAGLLHLGIGQGAVAVGADRHLNHDDYALGGHRRAAAARHPPGDPVRERGGLKLSEE